MIYKWMISVGLLLTTSGDYSRRGKWGLQCWWPSSVVDHTRWLIGRDAPSRGSIGVSWYLLPTTLVVQLEQSSWYVFICPGSNFWTQVALLWQRDRTRHLSVEILQLQNISLENPIVWHYLCDSTFSRFDTIPECNRHTHTECMQTDRHTIYIALSIASRGKNRPYCTAHQL